MKSIAALGSKVSACVAIASATPLLAQNGSDAVGAAGCAACGGIAILIPIVLIGLNIALLVWVARNAKSRGMDNSVLWMLLVLFTGPVGLIIYLLSRPQGDLVPCPNCQNKKLQASVKCPHCGA